MEKYWERRNAVLTSLLKKFGGLYYAALTGVTSLWFYVLGRFWTPEFYQVCAIFAITTGLILLVELLARSMKSSDDITVCGNDLKNLKRKNGYRKYNR